MPIFTTPKVGDLIVPNIDYIEANPTIVEAYGLRSGQPYEVMSVVDLKAVAEAEGYPSEDISGWGIDKIRHINSEEILDINDGNPETEEWFAFFIEEDSARLIQKE